MMINNPLLRFRHELKFNIDASDAEELSWRLKKIFPHDENADSHGMYRVNSLYFDTPDDAALRQKNDGVNKREKFRLRYYNTNTDFLRLEKKMKINGLCAKQSARLSEEEARKIMQGDIAFLLKSENPLLIEFYSKMQSQLLRPKTIVTYNREAFLYGPGNVRVTLDHNVRSGLADLRFFNSDLCHVPVHEGNTVLEVKYDAFLPEIVKMAVKLPNIRLESCSKYVLCRRFD